MENALLLTSFSGPGSSQNLPSAYFIREQERSWQNFGHHLALKGCETNNIQKVGLV